MNITIKSGGPKVPQNQKRRMGRLHTWTILTIALVLAGVAMISTGQSGAAEFPLDKYPGFGRSPEAALRDNTIAYWEAFRREQVIASCLNSEGFEYSTAVAFPPNEMPKIAANLGLAVGNLTKATLSPAETNQAYQASLSLEERDLFTRAFVGESAADLAEADRTQMTPPGRGDDFATGGCVGKAASTVPSVWSLRRQLSGDYDAMRRGVSSSSEFQETRAKFTKCAQETNGIKAAGPGDLERIASGGGVAAKKASATLRECMPIWDEGYRAIEIVASGQFIKRNSKALAGAERAYEGAMDKVRQDKELAGYLSKEVVRLKTQGASGRP